MRPKEQSTVRRSPLELGARRHDQVRHVDLGIWCWPVLLVVAALIVVAVVTV
jgi:hypothetical protein